SSIATRMPPAITIGQADSNNRHIRGAWRSSMKPSEISQALTRATTSTLAASSSVEPELPRITVVMERTARPNQQPISTFEADIATSSVEYVDQRKQQHPDHIHH